MTEWQYFLSGGTPQAAESGAAGLNRLPVGAPVSLAEALTPAGDWIADDRMWRAKYQGSDYEFTEVGAADAERLIARWVEIGRIAKVPESASSFTPDEHARLVEADRQARAAWARVQPPPGAESITF